MKAHAAVLAAMAVVLAACGGGGGGDPEPPELGPPSGLIDVSYGVSGKATFPTPDSILGATVDAGGNVYATGNAAAKLDRSGNRVAGYGEMTGVAEYSPVIDDTGNLFALTGMFTQWMVKRDASGRLVTGFSDSTRLPFPWPGGFGGAMSQLRRDASGNLYIVGLITGPHFSFREIVIAKVNPSGQFDSSFGEGGVVRVAPLNRFGPVILDATLDAAGHVLVAGQLESNQRSFVARLDLQGRLMPAFGNGGMWQAPDDCTAGFELAAGAAGEIFAGGKCRDSLIVYKLDSQGVPVSSFGNGGAAVFGTRVGSIDALQASAGGSVYVAGSLGDGSCKDLAVWKLDANGVPFANFGSAGIALPGIQAGGWSTLALDATGLLYAGASVPTCPTPDSSLPKPFVVVRLSG